MPLLRNFNVDFGSSQTTDTVAGQIWPENMKQNAYYHNIFDKFPSCRKKSFYAFLNRFSI